VVDESLFGRWTKYHCRDPRGMKIWIFGLVERNTNRLKLFPVHRSYTDTLLSLIKCNVETGSTIITDGSTVGYTHYVIEHKKAFSWQCRDKTTGELKTMHANRIEGCWKHAKDNFKRMNRTKVTQYEAHLCEFMWRWWDRCPKPEAFSL